MVGLKQEKCITYFKMLTHPASKINRLGNSSLVDILFGPWITH